MSEEEKNLAHAHIDTIDELEDLQDWWQKHGNRVSLVLCVVLAILLAYNLYDRHRQSSEAKASIAYSEASSAEAMEEVVAGHKSAAVAPLALLRLGSDYYHRQKYDLAQGAYENFLRDYPKHEFAPIAIVGQAHVAEAKGLMAEAEVKFRDFATSYPEHYLTPVAMLGQARCVALQDRKDEARAILDRMMADRAGTAWAGLADDLLAALPRLEHVAPTGSSFTDALKAFETSPSPAATNAPAEAEASEVAPSASAAPTNAPAAP